MRHAVVIKVHKASKLGLKLKLDNIEGTVTMLGNDKLGLAAIVLSIVVRLINLVVLGAVEEAYDIGILLNGS